MKPEQYYREKTGRKDIIKLLYKNEDRNEWTFDFIYGWAGTASIREADLLADFEQISLEQVRQKVLNYQPRIGAL
jgi:hypothetical protein